MSSKELLRDTYELVRGEYAPHAPVEFVRDEGRTSYDLVGTTYASLYIVSDHFLDTLRVALFTGWETFPVQISSKGQALEGYHGFCVTGRCGAIDDRLSEPITLPPPVPEGKAWPGLRGLCFPPESWDGSDIFTSEERASVFVVERVKLALEEAKVTNVEFRRLSEMERMVLD